MQQTARKAISDEEAIATLFPDYIPAGTDSGQDKPVQPQDSRVIPFPTVGKYTDAADDLDSARFAKAVAAHVTQHFPGTLHVDGELPECKVVHPDDMAVAQVAHDLGFTPPPVKQGNIFRDPPFYSAYDAEYVAPAPMAEMAPSSPERVEDKNQAVPYLFKDQPVRAIAGHAGEVWFVARDVARVLDLAWHGKILDSIPETWKGVRKLLTPSSGSRGGGEQSVTVINEAGLYKLAFRSNKPEAEEFTNWVAFVVLPSIRKHGAYMTPQTIEDVLENPDLVIGLATRLKEERARTAALEVANARIEAEKIRIAEENIALEIEKHGLVEENAALAPKAEIYDAFMDSTGTIEIDGAAKLLQNDFPWIGPQKLWNLLKRRGVLLKNRDPKQYHLNAGYFRSIVRD